MSRFGRAYTSYPSSIVLAKFLVSYERLVISLGSFAQSEQSGVTLGWEYDGYCKTLDQ